VLTASLLPIYVFMKVQYDSSFEPQAQGQTQRSTINNLAAPHPMYFITSIFRFLTSYNSSYQSPY